MSYTLALFYTQYIQPPGFDLPRQLRSTLNRFRTEQDELMAWVPAGTGRGILAPGKVVKCFGALVMTVKRSVDELGLFMPWTKSCGRLWLRMLLICTSSELHRQTNALR